MNETNNFCPRPFHEISLQSNGDAFPCCLLHDYILGNIKKNTILELWNSDKMQKLRREFKSGTPVVCKDLIKNKKCHLMYESSMNNISKDIIQTTPPRKLDLRLSGKCNLECIMCQAWRDDNYIYDETTFWKEGPEKIFPYLDYLDLLGGEPFVQQSTFKLIDAVYAVNKDCLWGITTNGNWKLNEYIKNSLNKIKIASFAISLDSIFPDTYLRIRKKASYKLVMQLIEDMIVYRDKSSWFLIRLDFCVQKENYSEVFPFINFCKSKGIDHSFIFLTGPKQCSVLQLNRDLISDYYNQINSEYIQTGNENLLQIIWPLKNHLTKKP